MFKVLINNNMWKSYYSEGDKHGVIVEDDVAYDLEEKLHDLGFKPRNVNYLTDGDTFRATVWEKGHTSVDVVETMDVAHSVDEVMKLIKVQ